MTIVFNQAQMRRLPVERRHLFLWGYIQGEGRNQGT